MLSINILTRLIRKCSYSLTTFETNGKLCDLTFSYRAYIRKRYSSLTGPWNVLFFGTDDFSLESLRSLYNEHKTNKLCRLEVVSVYKGKKNAVIRYAEEKGIVINRWPLENDPRDFHIGIVVSFGHLIPLNIINSFPLGMLNVHASLLPRWRGAAPIIYSLINGDRETGITIMKIMPEKFDIGEIIVQKKLDIHINETLPELYTKLAKIGANVLIDVIRKLPQILSSSKPQENMGITYAPKVTSKISLVKWDKMTAKNVYDLYRGLLELYSLTTNFGDRKIKLFDIQQVLKLTNETTLENDLPGLVRFDEKNSVLIVTCKGPSWISIKKITIAGGAPMTAIDFRNGFMQRKIQKQIFFGVA